MAKNTGRPAQAVIDEADEVREVTLDEAGALPGMLGAICRATLAHRGWYGCRVDGRKVMFVLK
jgi:hypothetical protein